MLYIVVYDVSDDRARDRVRELVKDFGGERIQYSAFKVELTEPLLTELLNRSLEIIGSGKGQVMAIPVCRRDLEKMIEIPSAKPSLVF